MNSLIILMPFPHFKLWILTFLSVRLKSEFWEKCQNSKFKVRFQIHFLHVALTLFRRYLMRSRLISTKMSKIKLCHQHTKQISLGVFHIFHTFYIIIRICTMVCGYVMWISEKRDATYVVTMLGFPSTTKLSAVEISSFQDIKSEIQYVDDLMSLRLSGKNNNFMIGIN